MLKKFFEKRRCRKGHYWKISHINKQGEIKGYHCYWCFERKYECCFCDKGVREEDKYCKHCGKEFINYEW